MPSRRAFSSAVSGMSDAAAYSCTSSTETHVGSTVVNAGSARIPAIAAWPIGAARALPQEPECLGLVEVVEHVLLVAVRAVILWREHGVACDPARQRVRRVRHAGDQPDASFGDGRLGRERAPRLLLEHVEHRLQRHDRTTTERFDPFVDPADRRAERDAELADLALGAQLLELLPQLVVEDRLDARVVELVQVDVIGAEALQRGFELPAHGVARPVVRSFRLARVEALGLDVVPALGGEDDLVAPGTEHIGEQLLTDAALPVDGRGVDEVDAGVERGVEQPLLVLDDSPPVTGESPDPEADLGDLEVALSEAAVSHSDSLRHAPTTRQARNLPLRCRGAPHRRAALVPHGLRARRRGGRSPARSGRGARGRRRRARRRSPSGGPRGSRWRPRRGTRSSRLRASRNRRAWRGDTQVAMRARRASTGSVAGSTTPSIPVR